MTWFTASVSLSLSVCQSVCSSCVVEGTSTPHPSQVVSGSSPSRYGGGGEYVMCSPL
jgi:hypothetical protein